MANRFAWSWKLADLGYPVILVYLGFLGAEEMRCEKQKQAPFDSHSEWEGFVKAYSEQLFPVEVWNCQLDIGGQPFVPRICSIKTHHNGPIEEEF